MCTASKLIVRAVHICAKVELTLNFKHQKDVKCCTFSATIMNMHSMLNILIFYTNTLGLI